MPILTPPPPKKKKADQDNGEGKLSEKKRERNLERKTSLSTRPWMKCGEGDGKPMEFGKKKNLEKSLSTLLLFLFTFYCHALWKMGMTIFQTDTSAAQETNRKPSVCLCELLLSAVLCIVQLCSLHSTLEQLWCYHYCKAGSHWFVSISVAQWVYQSPYSSFDLHFMSSTSCWTPLPLWSLHHSYTLY